ncbi:MAG: CFI-box-CTERM domain-containing protein [Syntrophales bacterium]
MKKYLIAFGVFALCFSFVNRVYASYSYADLTGNWAIFENESFNVTYDTNNPIYTQSYINGSINIGDTGYINSGSWHITWQDPRDPLPRIYHYRDETFPTGQSNPPMALNSDQGLVFWLSFYTSYTLNGSAITVTHSMLQMQIAPDKDIIILTQMTPDLSSGVGMGYWIKQDPTVSFSTDNLAGTWHFDNPDGTSGSITIDASGNVTGLPGIGQLTVGQSGAITEPVNIDQTTGQLNAKKNAFALVYSTGIISPLFVKQDVTMVQADMVGTHRFCSLFGPSSDGKPAGITYGYITLDTNGKATDCNYTGLRPDGTTISGTSCKNWNMNFLFSSSGQATGGFTNSDSNNIYTVQSGQVNNLKNFVSMRMSVTNQALTPLFSDRSYWVNAPTPPASTSSTTPSNTDRGGNCFIATAAYGSYLDPNVRVLRDFRDNWLLTNAPGRSLVGLYYHYSPPLADYIRRHESCRVTARLLLTPVVYTVKYPSLLGLGSIFTLGLIIRRRRRYSLSIRNP